MKKNEETLALLVDYPRNATNVDNAKDTKKNGHVDYPRNATWEHALAMVDRQS